MLKSEKAEMYVSLLLNKTDIGMYSYNYRVHSFVLSFDFLQLHCCDKPYDNKTSKQKKLKKKL